MKQFYVNNNLMNSINNNIHHFKQHKKYNNTNNNKSKLNKTISRPQLTINQLIIDQLNNIK